MRNIWTIAVREYKLYFSTPVAYVVAFIILLILGLLFAAGILASYQSQGQFTPGVGDIVGPFVSLMLFGAPALTMRLIADEQRMGTIELLLTAPIRDFELVVGKWLGGFLFLSTLIAVTWVYPIVLNLLIDPGIDQGLLLSGYLGLLLVTAAFVAIGVAVSALFSNQIAAFFATLGVYLVLWLMRIPAQFAGEKAAAIFDYLDFRGHFFNTFVQGIIDVGDITYYVSLTVLALFLGSVLVETRRWR